MSQHDNRDYISDDDEVEAGSDDEMNSQINAKNDEVDEITATTTAAAVAALQESVHVKFSPFITVMGEKTNEDQFGEEESMLLDGVFGASMSSTFSGATSSLMSSHSHSDKSVASLGSNAGGVQPARKLQGSWDLYRRKKGNFNAQRKQRHQDQFQKQMFDHVHQDVGNEEHENKAKDKRDSPNCLLTEKEFGSFGDLINWDASSSASSSNSGSRTTTRKNPAKEIQDAQGEATPAPKSVREEAPLLLEQSFSVFSLLGVGSNHIKTSLAKAPQPKPHPAPRMPYMNPLGAPPDRSRAAAHVAAPGLYPAIVLNDERSQSMSNDSPFVELEMEGEEGAKEANVSYDANNNIGICDDADKEADHNMLIGEEGENDAKSVVSTSEHDTGVSTVDVAEEMEKTSVKCSSSPSSLRLGSLPFYNLSIIFARNSL